METLQTTETRDKSLFYYGSLYHKLFDAKLEECRNKIISLIEEGSRVLDIGCGTGELCYGLYTERNRFAPHGGAFGDLLE